MEKEADASLPLFPYKRISLWGNGDDRRQRRKQGGAVGAAASRMQAAAQQTLGAATRHGRGEPERARMLTKNRERDDSIALTKSLPIAAQRLFRAGLALSVIASQCHLSHRERLWQVGPLPTGRLRRNMAQKGGPCCRGQQLPDNALCQAAAGLDSRALQSTKQINFARPGET